METEHKDRQDSERVKTGCEFILPDLKESLCGGFWELISMGVHPSQVMDKAERIARDLMTAGDTDRDMADSLKLYRKDGLYLGGWSLRGLTDRIRKHLSGELDANEREIVELNEDALLDDYR